MSLSKEQQKVLEEVREKVKLMKQVSKLEKEISSLRTKLEMKERKMSDLINNLDDQNNPNKNSSVKSKVEKGKPEDPSALFAEG